MAGGYMGRYCVIDLTFQTIETVEPDDGFYQKYLSGYGLGAAVIMERQKAGIHPLDPESHIGFCSGLLTGTRAYFSGRFMVVGKSPLTGGWGDANAGGFLSRELKRTGYDAIFFSGKSDQPVWVEITHEEIKFHDAGTIWGQDIIETERHIKDRIKDKWTQVAAIGVSGEKISLISGIATDRGRMAARSGLGAVMGSKQLKAVAFHGNAKIPVAHPEKVKAINKEFLEAYKKSKLVDRLTVRFLHTVAKLIGKTGISLPTQASLVKEVFRTFGTPGLTVFSALTGDMPIKNWTGVGLTDYTYEGAAKNGDISVIKHQKRRYACQACPLGCGGIIDIKKGRYKNTEGHKPEYETLGAFGGLVLNDDLDTIIELNEMCNRAGIDTISTGNAVAFAIECFENSIIDTNTTGGLQLAWGNSDSIAKLTEMIIQRQGIGDILADGVKKAAQMIGKGSEQYAVHAGGQELPMKDSRLDFGLAIAYMCEPTPGRHSISSYLYHDLYGVSQKFPRAKQMVKEARGKTQKNVRKYAAGSFYMQLLNGADEYLKTGERILSLRKAFNVREGIRPEDHVLNDRAMGAKPLSSGPLKGVRVDLPALKKEFFNTLEWDLESGGPTPEKMKALGIDNLMDVPFLLF